MKAQECRAWINEARCPAWLSRTQSAMSKSESRDSFQVSSVKEHPDIVTHFGCQGAFCFCMHTPGLVEATGLQSERRGSSCPCFWPSKPWEDVELPCVILAAGCSGWRNWRSGSCLRPLFGLHGQNKSIIESEEHGRRQGTRSKWACLRKPLAFKVSVTARC